jgi:hypothetical protein
MNVRAGGEGPPSGPGDHDRPDPFVLLHLTYRPVNLPDQTQAQRVQHFGPVQGDNSDPVHLVRLDELVTHIGQTPLLNIHKYNTAAPTEAAANGPSMEGRDCKAGGVFG